MEIGQTSMNLDGGQEWVEPLDGHCKEGEKGRAGLYLSYLTISNRA